MTMCVMSDLQACPTFQEVEFPLDVALDRDSLLTLEVVARNRYLQNRSLGGYGLVLQRLLEDGFVRINDYLVDSNNKIIQVSVLMYQFYVGFEQSQSGFLKRLHSCTGCNTFFTSALYYFRLMA